MRKINGRWKQRFKKVAVFLSVGLWVGAVFAGSDPLAGVIAEQITPALGTDSTAFKIILLIELFIALATIMKVRSWMSAGFVIGISIFFNAMYSHYVG